MNQTQIKQQLLENYSNKVLDVGFLDKYLCLCFGNIDTKRVKRVTEQHRILPRGYVKGRSKSSGEKGSKTRTGRHNSQEHKDKIRKAMLVLGDKHHMKQEKGRKWAKEVGVYHIHPEMLQENK